MKKENKKIGGWLIFYNVFSSLRVLFFVLMISWTIGFYLDKWIVYDTDLFFRIFLLVLPIFFQVAVFILEFKHKKIFIKYANLNELIFLIVTIIWAIFSNILLINAIFWFLLWRGYLKKSKRVKNTFVK